MTPQQAKIIAAWEELHPIFCVSPSKSHRPRPGDPWRFIVQQRDNNMIIGAVSREKFMATWAFNEPSMSQLRDCLMTGKVPRAAVSKPTAPQSPEGTLTAHPRDQPAAEAETKPTRAAPWKVTQLQDRILDAWENLHTELQVVADESHIPINFAPWKYLVKNKSNDSLVAKVSKYTQEVFDSTYTSAVEKLRSSLKIGHMPKETKPRPIQRRDPMTGHILPRLSPPTSHTPKPDPPSVVTPPGQGLPEPWPNCNKPIVLRGEAARYAKYGNHPEDWDEFEDRKAPKLKPRTKAYIEAKKRVEAAMAQLETTSREELTMCARLANLMCDKDTAHTLSLKATKTRPTHGTAAGFE